MEQHEHKWVEVKDEESTGQSLLKTHRCECGTWKYETRYYLATESHGTIFIIPPYRSGDTSGSL